MSTTMKRIISAFIILPIFIWSFMTDSFNFLPLYIIVVVFILLASYEYLSMAYRKENEKPFKGLFYLLSLYFPTWAYLKVASGFSESLKSFVNSYASIGVFLIVSLFVIFILQMFTRDLEGAVYSVSSTFWGLFYISFSGSHIILLRGMKDGIFYIFFLGAITFLTDSFGYFGGKLFGRRKLNLRLSPNKTYEGYITGLLGGGLSGLAIIYLFSVVLERYIPPIGYVEGIFLGFFLSLTAVLGDLMESALKRDAGVKDSGGIIPGHGGVLDLVDAFMINLPVFYYYLVITRGAF